MWGSFHVQQLHRFAQPGSERQPTAALRQLDARRRDQPRPLLAFLSILQPSPPRPPLPFPPLRSRTRSPTTWPSGCWWRRCWTATGPVTAPTAST